MNDRLFQAASVAEAVAAACRALGIAEAELRYVVIENPAPPRHGFGGAPARIAVLLEGEGPEPPMVPPSPEDPVARLKRVVGAIIQSADLALELHVDETAQAVRLKLEGPDSAYLAAEDGELLEAIEHLLSRMVGPLLHPRRLLVDGVTRREQREDTLRSLAREIGDQVRLDGTPRTTPPLNAYERRIIHLAIADEAGLRSFSTGEGRDRRVTIARAEPAEPPPAA